MKESSRTVDPGTLRQYLLGNLPDVEMEALEQLYFADDELLEELEAAESDLIDAYVRGKLPAAELRQFEAAFLSTPERRGKVEFARRLNAYADAHSRSTEQNSWWRSALRTVGFTDISLRTVFVVAAILVLTIAGASYYVTREGQRSSEAPQAQTPRTETPQSTPPSPGPVPEQPRRDAPSVLAVVLVPGMARSGGQSSTIQIAPDTTTIRMLLRLRAEDHATYGARLETVEGKTLATGSGLKPRSIEGGAAVAFDVPAARLAAGDYVVRLSGAAAGGESEDLDDYFVRAEKK